ncbi:MAG: sigma-70 family RNA polymerase sigma factor [Planctomycetes bacterium]|nr:sigma-70 family RNA polymerase sigma factor [Planctomycetota bacterium]
MADHPDDPATRPDDAQAAGELFALVYGELHAIAHNLSRRSGSVDATALINEAYLALCRRDPNRQFGREHFLRTAARVMRHLLIDHRRSSAARRRREAERHLLDDIVDRYEARVGDLLAVNDALERIGRDDPDTVRLIDLRFFVGLSLEECATAMQVSSRTITRLWRLARARLARELQP